MKTSIWLILLLHGSGFAVALQQGGRTIPEFADFPVRASLEGAAAAPRLESRQDEWPKADPKFRKAVTLAVGHGVDFGGAFTLVGTSCGTDCVFIAVVDLRTGEVHTKMPFFSLLRDWDPKTGRATWAGLEFRPDSRLLIAEGRFDATSGVGGSRPERRYYEWTGDRFRLLTSIALRGWGSW
jgi:hypothetical protein